MRTARRFVGRVALVAVWLYIALFLLALLDSGVGYDGWLCEQGVSVLGGCSD